MCSNLNDPSQTKLLMHAENSNNGLKQNLSSKSFPLSHSLLKDSQ
uniref:Uncharacterized protein n=1 Tax=Rhizophora mucronata TaxID=61149 RepID=A0A2P2PBQ2_RHIMU